MEYRNSFNGMVYHHSQQHGHEFRCGMTKAGYNNSYNNLYGHNQHISWNGMHHEYGNRNVPTACHYESYKANLAQNCFQSSSYSASNFDSPYVTTTSATVPPTDVYRSRFGGYQMCDQQQCFPNGGDNNRGDYMPLNTAMARCIDPLANNLGAPDPRNHQPYGHDTVTHHPHSMRMPSNHRPYESHQQKTRPFENDAHQSWYGHGHGHANGHGTGHPHNGSESINESNHHYYQYQHHHHALSNSNYNEYPQHIQNSVGNQYTAGALNGQLVTAKEDKAPKMHRDRSLSKLVAMNRRLETQMNESERVEPLHQEHFENFDYYTDYSETPDSITSSSQFTNNDCMMNNSADDTDNNNNVNGGALNSSHKNNCKEANNQQVTNGSEWLTTKQSDACTESQADSSSSKPSVSSDENLTKKSDLPSTATKSPAKQNTNKKIGKSKKATDGNPVEKRRKRRDKKSNTECSQIRELKTDTVPLPGFQQAFGSTEIGRFSEIFFNVSGSPIEIGIFESEADTLSPQPWEMGDSLEGPHFSMQTNNTPLSYAESIGSTDSPTASNNSFFSDLRASEF